MPEYITIPKTVYESLIEDSAFLRALESVGVDKWEGYEEAMKIFEDMNIVGDETRH